jgi:hypothetical protein
MPRKPKETPADNTGTDDAADNRPEPLERLRERVNINFGVKLPDLPGDPLNSIGAIAETMFVAGYWQPMTPAQIAVQILAGKEFGFGPIDSMFNLKISEGGKIELHMDDDSELQTLGIRDKIETKAAADREFLKDAGKHTTAHKTYLQKDEPAASGDLLEFPNLANKGPVSVRPGNGPLPTRDAGADEARPQSVEARAESAAGIDDPTELAEAMTNFAISGDPSGFFKDVSTTTPDPALEDPATPRMTLPLTIPGVEVDPSGIFSPEDLERPRDDENESPDPALSAEAELRTLGIDESDIPKAIETMREGVSAALYGLQYAKDVVNSRLQKYDDGNFAEKRGIYLSATNFYKSRLDAERNAAIARLVADGKPTLEQQKGFYLFCEVPTDPAAWTYADARKVNAEIDAAELTKKHDAQGRQPDSAA